MALLSGRCPILLIDEPELGLHPPRHTQSDDSSVDSEHHPGTLRSSPRTAATFCGVSSKLQMRSTFFGLAVAPAISSHISSIKTRSSHASMLQPSEQRRSWMASLQTALSSSNRTGTVPCTKRRGTASHPIFTGTSTSSQLVVLRHRSNCQVLQALKIPTAVIADLDLVVESQRLKDALCALSDEAKANPIIEMSGVVAEEIRRIPPAITEQQAKTVLRGRHLTAARLAEQRR